MILSIDTSNPELVSLALYDGDAEVASREFEARRRQSELLLAEIESLLVKAGKKLTDLDKIRVNDKGASFTSLRIGILSANALAYGLGIEVESFSGAKPLPFVGGKVVKPEYTREANIGSPKAPNC